MKKIMFLMIPLLVLSACGKKDLNVDENVQAPSGGAPISDAPAVVTPNPNNPTPLKLTDKNIGPSILKKIIFFSNCSSYETLSNCQTEMHKFYYDDNLNPIEIRSFKYDVLNWHANKFISTGNELNGFANVGDCSVDASDNITCTKNEYISSKIIRNKENEILSYSIFSGDVLGNKFDYDFKNGWLTKFDLTYEGKHIATSSFEEKNGKYIMSMFNVTENVFWGKSVYEKFGKEVTLKFVDDSGKIVSMIKFEFVN